MRSTAIQGYSHPHSFVRLPNGHVLVTYSMKHGERAGGLLEIDDAGNVAHAVSAVDSTVPDVLIRPYSMAVLPKLDRVVSTAAIAPAQAIACSTRSSLASLPAMLDGAQSRLCLRRYQGWCSRSR